MESFKSQGNPAPVSTIEVASFMKYYTIQHAKVFAMGIKSSVEALRELAMTKFRSALSTPLGPTGRSRDDLRGLRVYS